MRIARGVNMCNIALAPYSVISADTTPVTPPPVPPAAGCVETTVTVTSGTGLDQLANQYKTTVAQIMLDNNLVSNNGKNKLTDGQRLVIKCPAGSWSQPYGVWGDVPNNMMEVPAVRTCPRGTFVVEIYVKPSQWYTGGVGLAAHTLARCGCHSSGQTCALWCTACIQQ